MPASLEPPKGHTVAIAQISQDSGQAAFGNFQLAWWRIQSGI